MALNSSKVSAMGSPGLTAAATARTVSGGRNVASASSAPVDGLGFSSHIGVNDNRLWRYDEETQFESKSDDQPPERGTPFIIRSANGFKVDLAEETADSGGGRFFLNELTRGIGVYEFNMRITTPGTVRPGSLFNYRS